MADPEIVRSKINKRIDSIYHTTQDGNRVPFVCICCDVFLKPNEVKTISVNSLKQARHVLTPDDWNAVSEEVAQCYKYTGDTGDTGNSTTDFSFMSKMLLSPRSLYLSSSQTKGSPGFCICSSCKGSLNKANMPEFAIANNYSFGTTPSVLTELTDVELALITPVKTFGYCFAYTGGKNCKMKGSLSYYKVGMESIANSVAHFEAFSINENVVIMLYGKMTGKQRAIARKKNKARPLKIKAALEYLIANHKDWQSKNIDLENIIQTLKKKNPVCLDNSSHEEEENSNIETQESVKVYFPDGTMNTLFGGQQDLEKYHELVKKAKTNGHDIEVHFDLVREATRDYQGNNLVNACLIQFPYGNGGLHERRMKSDGSITERVDTDRYIQHLSRLSQSQFHHPLFCHIMFNFSMKQKMVRTATWKARHKGNAAQFAQQMTKEEVSAAISRKESGTINNGSIGGRFVHAVDTIAKAVPHTNEAAKRARHEGEALQHHFGLPHYFFTVTPDDENSLLIQVMSQNSIDDDTPIAEMTDAELEKRGVKRNELRINYPGICSFYYELMMDIVLEEVLGWDTELWQPKLEPGLFGHVLAFVASTEEQGRTTLHTHFQIWIEELLEPHQQINSHVTEVRKSAQEHLISAFDRVASCAFFDRSKLRGKDKQYSVAKMFDHNCAHKRNKGKIQRPQVVDDQQLRNLRHHQGCIDTNSCFVQCPHCSQYWSNEEVVGKYLIDGIKVPGLTVYPDRNTKRLKAMAIEFQKCSSQEEPYEHIKTVVNAAYNHHMHAPSSCFKCTSATSKKRKRMNSYNQECRYKYPKRAKRATEISNLSDDTVQWYHYDGTFTDIHVKQASIKRHGYDAFQNTCCPAVSLSKMTCNTNVSLLMPGPVGLYSFKYGLKPTQEDDTTRFENMRGTMEKVFSKFVDGEQKSDCSVAVSRLLAASFAHQQTNVLGATMSSYLTRHGSRFMFSHGTVWCPIRDLISLLDNKEVGARVDYHNNISFYANSALDYLCRPSELEDCSVHKFFTHYQVVKRYRATQELMQFCNSHFQHPSYVEKSNKFLQGVKLRPKIKLPKVFQYDFPDTATFEGNILDETTPINDSMERYALLALAMFQPFRDKTHLQEDGSYVKKFREAILNETIGPQQQRYLQNIQDAKANCLRCSSNEDDLQKRTNRYIPADILFDLEMQEEEELNDALEGMALDGLLKLLNQGDDTEEPPTDSRTMPKTLQLKSLKDKGKHQAGSKNIAYMQKSTSETPEGAIEFQLDTTPDPNSDTEPETPSKNPPKKEDLVYLLIHKIHRRTTAVEGISDVEESLLPEANGSAKSIVRWAQALFHSDKDQRRAFEILTGSFVLTFYDEQSTGSEEIGRHPRRIFDRERKRLRFLTGANKRGTDQLISALHGPGGCGKTTVIDVVMQYAKNFCANLEQPFTSQTIVVTAMTGVAASILLGETTHKAVHLNNKIEITQAQMDEWNNTRMLIVDEISFASKSDFQKIHSNLCKLKRNIGKSYGGLNIVFSGDLRQLEPIGKYNPPIYKDTCVEFEHWVNCFIEMNGLHRFKDNMAWGLMLRRFRDGTVTKEDLQEINKHVVGSDFTPPDDIQYATYKNKDRDAINAALFEKHCRHVLQTHGHTNDCIMILSDHIKVRNSSKCYEPFKNCKSFWEHCGESDIFKERGRMDPVLRLYSNCKVMMTANDDVKHGMANGTKATFHKAILKRGVTPTKITVSEGLHIQAVFASEVDHIQLIHSNDRVQPQNFSITPKEHTMKARMLKPSFIRTSDDDRELLRMQATQFPIVINNATTGHKLQGSSVDRLFVHEWLYATNWPYVVLSRVRTLDGLYLRKALNRDLSKYKVPEKLTKMLERMRKAAPPTLTEAEYEEILKR